MKRFEYYVLNHRKKHCTSSPLVPGQPLNFKAEPESETSILLSWTPPRSDTIANYELVYKDGEHAEEVNENIIFPLYSFNQVRHEMLQ